MENYNRAHKLLNLTVNELELTLGHETNRETTFEGVTTFRMTSMFCDHNNIISNRSHQVDLITKTVATLFY